MHANTPAECVIIDTLAHVAQSTKIDVGEGVQCIADLGTRCRGADGAHRGDWYFPDGTRLPFAGSDVDIFEVCGTQRVYLRRNSGTNSPTGIYHCDIPTIAVHGATNISVRNTVYVGLYTASGGICSRIIVCVKIIIFRRNAHDFFNCN